MFENKKFLAEFGLRALQEVSKSIPIPKVRGGGPGGRQPTAMDTEGQGAGPRTPTSGEKYTPGVRRSYDDIGGASKYQYARDPNAGTPNALMRDRIRAKFFG